MKSTNPKQKCKKQRGLSSHGWGHKKKHRGAGNRGGRGNAGTGKRADTKKPTIINQYGNTYFGRRGFNVPAKKLQNPISLRDIDRLIEAGTVSEEINLTEKGYTKLLGTGNISKPIKITIAAASKGAIEKVKKLGGEVILAE